MIDPRILREMLEFFNRAEVPIRVRASIAEELGERQYLPAREALLAGLSDSDANMRSACIRAVGTDMELCEAGPLLTEILLNDEFEHVRIDAAYGLGALRYKQALPALKEIILRMSCLPTVHGRRRHCRADFPPRVAVARWAPFLLVL